MEENMLESELMNKNGLSEILISEFLNLNSRGREEVSLKYDESERMGDS